MYSRGYSFQWNKGSNGEHSWFVLTDAKDSKIIVANISSYDPKKRSLDTTCIIKPSDLKNLHNRIRNQSFVVYRQCVLIDESDIDEIVANTSQINSRIPAWLVDQMASGIATSQCTPMKVKNFYKDIKTPTKSKG
ncbi:MULTISPECIES: hypothetical protein [Vibrio]|uniref:hypothetical protein n=1 Tax=Vibrio TaxID=662 RepID=UPI000E09F58E|nr:MULTISPECIES: hypothetical protein [Vibrio]EHD2267474.1 hypothetical protein [Vibrio cholerae]EKF9492256.1 hypothetical protein [Vibrio cholerae]ELP6989700.1 hypothetical protein [Vibrio vulnificus]MCR9400854.1 hypothetical protein [Vibrio cholerae]MDT8806283.1 hypothetical protein [Vibrio vulnificus]